MKDKMIRKWRLYWRTERALLETLLEDKLRQLFLSLLGLMFLFAVFTLLNIAGFFWLTGFLTHVTAAFSLAFLNGALFLLFVLLAKRKRHQKEVQALQSIRDIAKEEIIADISAKQTDLFGVGHIMAQISQLLPVIKQLLKQTRK